MRANNAFSGGAIFAYNAIVDIVDASIMWNMARKKGGGVYMHIPKTASFRFGIFARVNATNFHRNKAYIGGRSVGVLCLI